MYSFDAHPHIVWNFDSIELVNFLRSLTEINVCKARRARLELTLNLLSRTIRACKKAALASEEAKFEQYKLSTGHRITSEVIGLQRVALTNL
jgi:hypothetical protein